MVATGTPMPTPGATIGGLQLVGAVLTKASESPLAGVYVHGDYAYVGGMSIGYRTNANVGVRIVDLANLEVVGRIPLRRLDYFENHSHGDAVATRIDSETFQGDVAIVANGVPDDYTVAEYPMPFGIWDVADPSKPQFLSVLNLGHYLWTHQGGDFGDKPIDAKAVQGNYFYSIYNSARVTRRNDWFGYDYRLAVADLSDPRDPLVIGDWDDPDDAWLYGVSLNRNGTKAYVVGLTVPPSARDFSDPFRAYKFARFILYVLDIKDPKSPGSDRPLRTPESAAKLSRAVCGAERERHPGDCRGR